MSNDDMQEYDPDQRAAICYGQWRDNDRAAHIQGMKAMSTLSEKHRELLHKKRQIADQMAAAIKQEDEGGANNDEAATRFASLEAALADLDARINRLQAAMRAEAEVIGANNDNGEDSEENGEASMRNIQPRRFSGERVPALARKSPKQGPGLQAARFVLGHLYARFHNVPLTKAAEFVSNRFGDDIVARALNSGVTGEGGALIPQDFLADLIELLRALTAVRGAGPMTVGMPMGNLTIPRLAGGATAAYQNELDDISVSQERFDDVNFVAKKLTALVPVSNDLIRRAPIGVEEVVRDDLVQTLARREDLAFLRGDGTDKGPIGLRNLCLAANRISVAAMPATPGPGDAVTAVVNGLSAAILALQNGMSRMIRPTWIMSPTILRFIATARDQVGSFYYKDEIERGTLEGYPFKLSQQIPTNLVVTTYTKGSEIYFADMADVVIADTYNVVVDASDVASYNDGTGMVSSFQRDQSLFRVIAEHDFNMRHLQSLAILLTSDWAFAGVAGAPGAPYSTQTLNPTWSQAGAIRPAAATGANPPPTLTDPK